MCITSLEFLELNT